MATATLMQSYVTALQDALKYGYMESTGQVALNKAITVLRGYATTKDERAALAAAIKLVR